MTMRNPRQKKVNYFYCDRHTYDLLGIKIDNSVQWRPFLGLEVSCKKNLKYTIRAVLNSDEGY